MQPGLWWDRAPVGDVGHQGLAGGFVAIISGFQPSYRPSGVRVRGRTMTIEHTLSTVLAQPCLCSVGSCCCLGKKAAKVQLECPFPLSVATEQCVGEIQSSSPKWMTEGRGEVDATGVGVANSAC